VPDAFPVLVPEGFPWTFGTDEFDDVVQRSYGVNLGLEHLGPCEALDASAVRALPEDFLSKMAALDAFFRNHDRLPASRNVLRDSRGQTWLIDHGSCRFLESSRQPLVFAPGHVLGPEGIGRMRREDLLGLAQQALRACEEIPEPWLRELSWSAASLRERIEDRQRAVDAR
jgi:hypothetical protein